MKEKRKVLIVGDSRKMKGGVASVIKTMEQSYLWDRYGCRWLECQINASMTMKVLYLLRGIIMSIYLVPQYQIVHFHTTPGRGIRVQLPIFLYAYLWKRKIILHIHEGYSFKRSADDRVFEFCCKRANAVVTLGNMWNQYIPTNETSRIHAIYNPAPPVTSSIAPRKYFLFAAYLEYVRKGFDTLIKGWKLVIKKHPDWKLVVCVAGEVEQAKRCIESEHVEESVELTGWVDGARKQKIFSEAYGFLMTSISEGLPMSVLESLAVGVPVVTTPVGSLPEILTNMKDALVFGFNDAEGMAERVCELIEKKELRETIVKNGQVLAHQIRQSFIEQMDKLYNSLN